MKLEGHVRDVKLREALEDLLALLYEHLVLLYRAQIHMILRNENQGEQK